MTKLGNVIVDNIGKIAYDAYCQSTDGKSLASGETLPVWFALSNEMKNAWTAAAQAVDVHVRNSNEITLVG